MNHKADSTLFCGKETSITKRLRKLKDKVGEWHRGEKGKKEGRRLEKEQRERGKEHSGQHHARLDSSEDNFNAQDVIRNKKYILIMNV